MVDEDPPQRDAAKEVDAQVAAGTGLDQCRLPWRNL